MMSTGAMIKIKSHVVVESADPTSDLHPGDTGIILGAESWTFDPDDPVNSKETVYRCLVNGAIQHLFDHDFEFYTTSEVAVS